MNLFILDTKLRSVRFLAVIKPQFLHFSIIIPLSELWSNHSTSALSRELLHPTVVGKFLCTFIIYYLNSSSSLSFVRAQHSYLKHKHYDNILWLKSEVSTCCGVRLLLKYFIVIVTIIIYTQFDYVENDSNLIIRRIFT